MFVRPWALSFCRRTSGRLGMAAAAARLPVLAGQVMSPSSCAVRPLITAVRVEQYGDPEVMQLAQRALPELGPRQVLVSIKAAGVNPSDTYRRLGPAGPYASKPEMIPALPYTPGISGAGVIAAVGDEVTSYREGDRVYTSGSVTGTYAEQAVCELGQVHPLPGNATFAQGACVGIQAATAYYALHQRAQLTEGEHVFIHGASGAVGLAAVQLAKSVVGASGLVVGTAGTEAGEAAVRQAGADAVLNHRVEGYLAKAKEASPRGYNVILEMAAHGNLASDLQLAAHRGRVCLIGSRSEEIAVNPRFFMNQEVDVRGVFLTMATAEERAAMHTGLQRAMESGALSPPIGAEMQLGQAPEAHREVMRPSAGGATGGLVLLP